MFKNKVSILLLITLLSLLLVGCVQKEETPVKKQILKYNIGNVPKTLDPAKAADSVSITIINSYLEGLVRYGRNNKITPGIAEDWKISEDGKIYEFYLRDDVWWSNGDPVTAYDFEYAWKRVLNPGTEAIYAYQLYYLKNAQGYNMSLDENYDGPKYSADDVGVKAINEKTLRVELEAKTPQFLGLTSFATYMPVNRQIVETDPVGWADKPETLVGNGPFSIKEITTDQQIVLEKNPNYWDVNTVQLDGIKITLVPSEKNALQMFEKGEVDLVENVPHDQLPELVDAGKAFILPRLSTYYYALNTTEEPLDNIKVRRALALAINRRTIVEYITQGGQIPAMALVPYGMPDVGFKEDFREKAGQFFQDNNVKKAKELLVEAGYPNGEGFPEFTIVVNEGEGHLEVAQAVQKMWRENLNINTKIKSQETTEFLTTLRNLDYEIARDGWGADYLDPMTFLDLMMSPGISGTNNTGWANEQYDQLLDKAKATSDRQIRMSAMHQAEKILLEEMPIIPIYFYTNPYLDNGRFTGLIKLSFGPEFEFKWAHLNKTETSK